MSSTALDRRLQKLEGAFGNDDPRHYLGRPLVEWPDAALERALSMSDEERAELLEDYRSSPGANARLGWE